MEGKVLSDQVAAALDCYGNHDNYNNCKMGWLLLTVLESLWEREIERSRSFKT